MAFKKLSNIVVPNFNSAISCEFLSICQSSIKDSIRHKNTEAKQQSFAPSSMRCKRISWFRLNGYATDDSEDSVNMTLSFSSMLGIAIHEYLQNSLCRCDSETFHWINVDHWIRNHCDYECECEVSGLESKVKIINPPITFACDGIIQIKNRYFILEIKSISSKEFVSLDTPRYYHEDQVKVYSTFLNIPNILFLYVDRTFGEMKCFEYEVSKQDMQDVRQNVDEVLEYFRLGLAPDKLPKGDRNCTPSMCLYYHLCKKF